MTRRIIATVLAAALAVSSINVGTAQAGDRDAVRFIVGATALAIIGSALAAEQRRKQTTTHSYQGPRHQPQHDRPHYRKHRDDRFDRHGRHQGKRHRVSIPRACLRNVRARNGWTQGYAVRCTQNNTRARLPSDCVRRNYAQGPRLFYAPRCLRHKGFDA
ncbi:hypothetical protein OB2597_14401 [Pseudooceanicola batsensis HTCC2597]|uniref:Uncharacterized protein n=1 Tax=Pseudooceanicola batsensis (strain ATCC BAA-863 / DSM 15984 / KCTC 12145 / HTCC2597) TaxID=252305 RepID=A3U242_PSEBH|nr:hypothetical protein [Pseudooceanicola batsensis]EAQ01642.1 hypothetical protein OB2597_14401 [Pseudooceanicola batsensis HTCC2597]